VSSRVFPNERIFDDDDDDDDDGDDDDDTSFVVCSAVESLEDFSL